MDNKNSWEAFNALPTPEIKKLVRPNILKMDQMAVSRIMERIKNEEMTNTMHLMWVQEKREHLRNSVSIGNAGVSQNLSINTYLSIFSSTHDLNS